MISKDSNIIELEKKVERLESRIAFLEKHIQVDNNGISFTVGQSIISISENEIFIRSERTLNLLSGLLTNITSGSAMDLHSSTDMYIRGSMIHIN